MRCQSIVGRPGRLSVGLSVAATLLVGCASGGPQANAYRDGAVDDSLPPASETDPGEPPVQEMSDSSESTGSADAEMESPGVVSDDGDVVVFLAAGERMLKDTPYSGVLYESPEVYVSAAQLICDRLSAGDSVDEVVSDFITDVGLSPSVDADVTLAGTVLGAGVETLCPTFRRLL